MFGTNVGLTATVHQGFDLAVFVTFTFRTVLIII